MADPQSDIAGELASLMAEGLKEPVQNRRRLDPFAQQLAEVLKVDPSQVGAKLVNGVNGAMENRVGEWYRRPIIVGALLIAPGTSSAETELSLAVSKAEEIFKEGRWPADGALLLLSGSDNTPWTLRFVIEVRNVWGRRLRNIYPDLESRVVASSLPTPVLKRKRRTTGTDTEPAVWIEFTRSSHQHGGPGWEFGTCLWSPSRSKDGRDTYLAMRLLRVGDPVLHFLDSRLVGTSHVSARYREVTQPPPIPGPWPDRPSYYRVDLSGYTAFAQQPTINELLDRRGLEIRDDIERNHPQRYPFVLYDGTLRAVQGKYLTRCSLELLAILNGEVHAAVAGVAEPQFVERTGSDDSRWHLAGYISDALAGSDALGIRDEVYALSAVITAKSVRPPLSIGLFGDWGAGKSFFMDHMEEQVHLLSEQAAAAKIPTAFCTHVVQIRFNAWHYADANLWASLVSRVFEGLLDGMSDVSGASESARRELRAQLVTQLATSQDLLLAATSRQAQAKSDVGSATEHLEAVRRQHRRTDLKLRKVAALIPEEVGEDLQDENVHAALVDAAQQLNIPLDRIEQEFEDEIDESREISTNLVTILKVVWRSRNPLQLVVAMLGLVVLPACCIVAGLLIGQKLWGWTLAGVLSFGLTVAASIRPWLKAGKAAVEKLVSAQARLSAIVKEERARKQKKEVALQHRLKRLRADEISATEDVRAARARVASLRQEIDDIQAGRRLWHFIHERINAGDYLQHQGIVARVRRDFEKLVDLFAQAGDESGNADSAIPRVDRIILYVDDLDRCPEARVVEVLQAVHLLLAFPLFVVVVGVDSRWLLHSLQCQFPGLSANEKPDTEWVSTPQHYLEKIFQIPFSLRPMTPTGFASLVDSVLGPDETDRSITEDVADVADGEIGTPDSADTLTIATTPDLPGPANASEILVNPPLDLNPTVLELTMDERRWMKQLDRLIPSPRIAKRFFNTYRLLRAMLHPSQLEQLVSARHGTAEYPIVLFLLAMLCGHALPAMELFRDINRAEPGRDAREVIKAALNRRTDPASESASEPASGVVPHAVGWRRFARSVAVLDEGLLPGVPISRYQYWIPIVTRFSFQPSL
jgi:hypothetical protein